MNVKIRDDFKKDDRMMRSVYCDTLMEMAGKDGRVVALDADLMNSMGMMPFLEKFPERTFNCGVQEANMMGVAAGLSATGKIPFAHTFGPFATRRCFDQVFISAAYAKLNVRIVGSDPGITAAYNGGTHMPFEDMGLMRAIPGATVIEPTDGAMLRDLLWQLKDLYGVFYLRLLRKEPVMIYEEGSRFEIGKGIVLQDGWDVTLIASGVLTSEALRAAGLLKGMGISARVVNMFTWKPVDRELIGKCARETGCIVTVENHNIMGGLGSAVAEAMAETTPVPMERIGSRDRFGEVGPVDYLIRAFHMTAEDIAAMAQKAVKRK
ncbi:MAG: transketolase family protein [Lentisphaerae bacterium]|nr:transketolase family protein [Lentisphaerota bacterium]